MLRTVFQAVCKKDPGRTIELDIPEGRFGDPVVFLEATMRAVALGEITPQEAALLARLASVMVQAQRIQLRIEQFKAKAKSKDVAVEAPKAKASDDTTARVDRHETLVPPVSRLYSCSQPVEAGSGPEFPGETRSSIPPVNPHSGERRKAA
jgi:hypothetical protein